MTKNIILFITIAMIVMTSAISVSGATITAPQDITREATGLTTYIADSELGIPTVVPVGTIFNHIPTGNNFPLGSTNVMWEVDNGAVTAMQVVTIEDMTGPTITITGPSAVTITVGDIYMDAGATATDIVDGNIAVASIVSNVDTSMAGNYSVIYDVTDNAGNKAARKTRTVKVVPIPIVDTVPPTITAPLNITVQAVTIPMHVTLGTPTVSDNIDVSPTVTNNTPSGSNFPVGETIVTWTACDHATPTPNCNNATQLVIITPAPIKLLITSYGPPSLLVEDIAPSNIKFNITMNQAANVVWNLDGVTIQSKPFVVEDFYRANFATIGSHVLTVNVQNGTDSDAKTWNWNIKGTLDVSAYPAFVNIGQSTNVTLKVSRRCGIELADNCTGSMSEPGANILLVGIVTGSGVVNDTTGEFVVTVNTTNNGTINVTASKSGYLNAYTNITVGSSPVVAQPSNSGSSSGGGGGGSSSGGGGGGGGTDEPYDNILKFEVQERTVYTAPVSFKYITPELGIYNVWVTSMQSDAASLRIEVLKGTSKLVGSPAPGIVYKNINAWMDYKRIKNATMQFKVENTWIDNNGISADKVKMSTWDNTSKKWTELLTNMVDKDGMYTYFESQTNSFSSFAISGIKEFPVATVGNGTLYTTANIGAANIGTANQEPIATNGVAGKDSTKFQIGIVAIVIVLVFYMLRIKKN